MDWQRTTLTAIAALIPLGIGALTTIAWQNSHALTALTHNLESMRTDLATTKASLEPGRTIQLRQDHAEKELDHLRQLMEDRLTCLPPVPSR